MSKESREIGEILVGKKPSPSYLQAILTAVARGASEIVLKARGANINRAVNISQIALKTIVKDFEVHDVKIGSQELEGGRRSSTIEIRMRKKPV